MSLETRINGKLIAYTYIHNEGFLDEAQTTSLYYVEYHRIGENVNPKEFHFYLKHNRAEGVEKLTQLVYREVGKRLKKLERNKNS